MCLVRRSATGIVYWSYAEGYRPGNELEAVVLAHAAASGERDPLTDLDARLLLSGER